MDKLLVTGLSGFLGWHISNEALKKYKVYGTVYKNLPNSANIKQIPCNLSNRDEIDSLFKGLSPDLVIHTAAISQPAICENNPTLSDIVNKEVPIYLASKCQKNKIPFIFTSSDMVFDGNHAPYDEKSPKKPKNIYGKHKSIAEECILQIYPDAAVCRMPLMFGPKSPFSESFIQPIVNNLKNSIKSFYFSDEYRTPISAWDVSDFFLNHIGTFSGILNLGGDEKVSRFDFSLKVCAIGEYSKSLINSNSQNDVQLPAPRPKDLTMNNSLAKSKGFKPKKLEESLRRLKGLGEL